MKFPEVTKPETIEKKYLGKLSKKSLSFMKSLLRMDPSQRLTADEALAHPYFDGLRNEKEPPPVIKEMNTMRMTSRHEDPSERGVAAATHSNKQQQHSMNVRE